MASLNNALKSALDGWKSDDMHATPPPASTYTGTTHTGTTYKTVPMYTPTASVSTQTTSVSESTFTYIRDNPRLTRKDAIGCLTALGYNPASTASLISALVRQGLVNQDYAGLLTANVSKYEPIRAIYAAKKPVKAPHKQVRITVKGEDINGIAALANKPDVAYNINSLLDNISVNEARALYLQLKSMFGGN
jgi:hypothetical protein